MHVLAPRCARGLEGATAADGARRWNLWQDPRPATTPHQYSGVYTIPPEARNDRVEKGQEPRDHVTERARRIDRRRREVRP